VGAPQLDRVLDAVPIDPGREVAATRGRTPHLQVSGDRSLLAHDAGSPLGLFTRAAREYRAQRQPT
jgi:hypothetical protein